MPTREMEVKAAAREVMEDMRLDAIPVPARMSFAKLGKGVPAFYAFATDELVLDDRCRFWKDPAIEAVRMFDAHWWSTSNPRHPIIHEIGHEAHYKTDPRLYNTLEYRNWSPDELAAIAGKVSKYAETSIREFIAEVFAATWDGVEYDEDVMRIYRMFHGFPLP